MRSQRGGTTPKKQQTKPEKGIFSSSGTKKIGTTKFYSHGARSNFSSNSRKRAHNIQLDPIDNPVTPRTNYNNNPGSPASPTYHDLFSSTTRLQASRTNTDLIASDAFGTSSLTDVLLGLEQMNAASQELAEAEDNSYNGIRPPPAIWSQDSPIAESVDMDRAYSNQFTPNTVQMLSQAMAKANMDIDGNPFPEGYSQEIINSNSNNQNYNQNQDDDQNQNQNQPKVQINQNSSNPSNPSPPPSPSNRKSPLRSSHKTLGLSKSRGNLKVPATVIPLTRPKTSNSDNFNTKISSSYDNTCEELWIYNYANDKHKYHSESLWAETTLAETQILVKTNTLPANSIASMSTQMVLDMEPRFHAMFGPIIHKMLDDVMNSIFILRDEHGFPSCEAAALIMDRNDVFSNSGQKWLTGVEGSKQKLEQLMKCPTYFDQCRYFWGLLKKEIVIRPHCFKKMEQMRKEKLMETRMIHRTCNHWARGVMFVIFGAWKGELEVSEGFAVAQRNVFSNPTTQMGNKRHLLGKYLMGMMTINVKKIFAAWKKYHKESMRVSSIDSVAKAKIEAKKAQAETKKLNLHNSGQVVGNRKARTEAEKVMGKVRAAKDIYEMPARQTPILLQVIQSFAKVYKLFSDFQDKENEEHIKEQFRIGDDAIRMDPLYKWTGVGINEEKYAENKARCNNNSGDDRPEDLLDAGSFDYETDCDEKDESTINKWIPGTFKSVEKTPAFQPMSTRAGRRTMRWLNNCLRHYEYDNTEKNVVECVRCHDDLSDGKAITTLLLHLANKAEEVKSQCVAPPKQIIEKILEKETKNRLEGCNKETFEESPQILNIISSLQFCRDNFNGSCNYVNQKHITGLEVSERRGGGGLTKTRIRASERSEQQAKRVSHS